MGAPLYRSAVRFYEKASSNNMAVNGSVTPQVFTLTPPTGTVFTVWTIKFSFVAPWTPTLRTTYSKFMDHAALTNGILVRDIRAGEIDFETVIKSNYDLLTLPVSKWTNPINDSSDAVVEIVFDFNSHTPETYSTSDYSEITIRDNLTFLKYFRASARGDIKLT